MTGQLLGKKYSKQPVQTIKVALFRIPSQICFQQMTFYSPKDFFIFFTGKEVGFHGQNIRNSHFYRRIHENDTTFGGYYADQFKISKYSHAHFLVFTGVIIDFFKCMILIFTGVN